MPDPSKKIKSSTVLGRIFRVILLIAVALILFVLGLTLAIQIPAVQNYLKNTTELYLKNKLQTEVSIEKIRLEWLSRFGLEKMLIKDLHQDTAFYIGHVSASIDMNIIDLLQKRISVKDISFDDVTIYNTMQDGDTISSFSYILQRLFPPREIKSKTTGSGPNLEIGSIGLNRVEYFESNGIVQNYIKLKGGRFEIDEIDPGTKYYHINSLLFDQPEIQFFKANRGDTAAGSFTLLDDTTLHVLIDKFKVENGQLSLNGWPENSFLHVFANNLKGINISIDQINLLKGRITSRIQAISTAEGTPVGINALQSDETVISNTEISLNKLHLVTAGGSTITDTFSLGFHSFADFSDFSNRVVLTTHFDNSILYANDVANYIPSLQSIDFIKRYGAEKLVLKGNIRGSINELSGKNLDLNLGDKFLYKGRFESSGLSTWKDAFISMRIDKLETRAKVLDDLIPALSKLKNFNKLGNLSFKGNFDGNPKDFVTYGILNSDLGFTKLDMRLNTLNGIDAAHYSGEIALSDFNLSTWTDDPEIGSITAKANIRNGIGFRATSASANLEASIQKFVYKGYQYSNVNFKGELNKQLLDGLLTISDPNAQLDFQGKIDFTDKIPVYDFTSDIQKLDLYQLKLVKTPFAFAGRLDFNLKGRTVDELTGTVNINEMHIEKDTNSIVLHELSLLSTDLNSNTKTLQVQSDWINGTLDGSYSLAKLWPSLKSQLSRQFPSFLNSLKLQSPSNLTDSSSSQAYRFNFDVKDVSAIRILLNQKIYALPFHIEGSVDEKKNYLLANWSIPRLQVNDLNVFNSIGRVEAKGQIGYTTFRIDSTFSKNFNMPYLELTADVAFNKANFTIKTPKVSSLINNIDLKGTVELLDSTYHINFTSSTVSFLDRKWKVLPNNEIAYRKGYLNTRNLVFENENEKISFSSTANNGLKLEVSNLAIGFLNNLLVMPQWKLSGKVNFKANVDDVFALRGLKITGIIDSLHINKSYFGLVDFNANTENIEHPIKFGVAIMDQNRQLLGQGFYDINGKFSNGIKNNYQMQFVFKDFPLRIFEYLMDEIVDNTKGNITGNLDIKYSPNGPDLNGKVQIRDGGFKVNYLGTTYSLGDQSVTVNNNIIDVSGVNIYDEFNNVATLSGGLTHNRFKNFSLNAGISSSKLEVLKTTKDQNKDYYGTLMGSIIAKFYGPFEAINIDVKGVVARPSSLNIPISQATATTNDRIVQYRPKKQTKSDSLPVKKRLLASKGISVAIDLSINDDAEIALIFDEKKGDILKGTGTGDMQMRFERTGGISMYGNYEVNKGDYLFTYGLINKPFAIRPGGTIRWNGDPLDADINLDADYKGLTSNLINLLPEYQGTLDINELSSQVAVDLSMHLFGKLFRPEIIFNLEIPNLTGNLRSIVDNKLNLLKADQNALNQQVLGLMIWGSFLPPNQLVASSGVLGSTINNLSQFVSNQLSLLVENALKELVADNNVISGFDFDVNYFNSSNTTNLKNAAVFDELNINLGPKFFEDRLSVDLGANFVNSSLFDRLITPHFEVEYALTADRRLKIKAYARKDDINQGQLKDRIGGGISWRKEFDSVEDFKKQLGDDLRNKDQSKKNDGSL